MKDIEGMREGWRLPKTPKPQKPHVCVCFTLVLMMMFYFVELRIE
jgi:hypothetical protein